MPCPKLFGRLASVLLPSFLRPPQPPRRAIPRHIRCDHIRPDACNRKEAKMDSQPLQIRHVLPQAGREIRQLVVL
eukprot:COSAG01_NODE_3250_length_6353_cov_445.752958_4_plen_75_part_00